MKKILALGATISMCVAAYGSSSIGILDPILGNGYDYRTKQKTASCLKVDSDSIVYTGKSYSSLKFVKDTSLEGVLKSMSAEASLEVMIEAVKISGAAKFSTYAARDEFGDSVVISYKVRGKNAMIIGAKLNDYGAKTSDLLEKAPYVKARGRCGDGYVSEVELGADLNLAVKISFLNDDFKSSFEAEIKADIIDLIKVSGHGKTKLNKYKDFVKIEVIGYQRGGTPDRLSEVFDSNSADGVHILSCGFGKDKKSGLDGMEHCLKAIENFFKYMNKKGGFVDQINSMSYDVKYKEVENTDETSKPASSTPPDVSHGRAAIIGSSFKTYRNGGYENILKGDVPGMSEVIRKYRSQIVRDYIKFDEYYSRAEQLLDLVELEPASFAKTGEVSEKDRILALNKKLIDIKNMIIMANKECKINPLGAKVTDNKKTDINCTDAVKVYEDLGSGISEADFKIKKNFYHYCIMARSEEVKKDPSNEDNAESGINVGSINKFNFETVKRVAYDVYGETDLNNCLEIYTALLETKDLDLSYDADNDGIKKLKTLEPIAEEIANIESIDISNNEIYDLTLLEKATKLSELIAPGNKIDDLTPLLSITSLKNVDLSMNSIPFVYKFRGATSMSIALNKRAKYESFYIDDNPLLDTLRRSSSIGELLKEIADEWENN